MKKAFLGFQLAHGLIFDNSENAFPTNLYGFTDDGMLHLEKNTSTFFGYMHEGVGFLHLNGTEYPILPGMYFCVPGTMKATLTGGSGIIIERVGYNGIFSIGGPIESKGRLKYIDGCTDALLVPPVKVGDPCLNALYFPTGIDQTMHTHPSMRVGMVVKGSGECVTPEATIPLKPGMLFIINEEGKHKFRTTSSELIVVAYHPDSDHGPMDEDHPMLNRTMVDGVSAREIDSIRTK